jgi:hypothetical protein
MFDVSANSRALLGAQSPIGGFGKAAGDFPGESAMKSNFVSEVV